MELLRALALLCETPGPESARIAELLDLPETPAGWQYAEVFLQQLPPYASIYLGDEGQIGGEARDRIAGFWRALGQAPPADADHLAVLLALLAELGDRAAASAPGSAAHDAWQRARAALLWEHLLSWTGPWLAKLRQVAPPPYVAWGELLASAFAAEASALTLPDKLPLHLRVASALPTPEEGGEAFLTSLLAPARAGFLLTRFDLARIAARTGLGVRAGERAYTLRALLSQDAGAVLAALAAVADEAVVASGHSPPLIAAHLRERASMSAARLREAASVA